MAADTRPYKSKEQDGQGNEVIIRDQQLVEQTSQTTMASGEYFEIVDVDGRMAKIPKDNMIGVVREALGSLLNGLTDQTTVTKVPSLNGNTLGASTVATLASVLGVDTYIKYVNMNITEKSYTSPYKNFLCIAGNEAYVQNRNLLFCSKDSIYMIKDNNGDVGSGKSIDVSYQNGNVVFSASGSAQLVMLIIGFN